MNTMNNVSNTSNYAGLYVPQVMPSMYLPKEQYATPENINTIKNRLYEEQKEQEEIEQSNKQAIWETAMMGRYIENQKSVVEAYVTSATGEKMEGDETTSISLIDTYMSLKAFQDDMVSTKPTLPDYSDYVQVQPLNQKIEANLEQYRRNQYESVNSLLHLSA